MKKITSKNLSKRLVQYGALSAAALGVADASGQIVYTDLDPDEVLNVGDDYLLDFNGDFLTNITPTNPDGLTGGNAAIVFPSSGGAFVGITAGGFEYPALMAEGEMIDGAAGYTATGIRGDLNYYGCAYSNSQWCDAVVDGYLGVRFTVSGNTHYGWVRMDTDVNGTNIMTIKDFAFEATPDTGIAAGDMGPIAGIEENAFEGFSYFVDANDNLNVKSSVSIDNVEIYNITGQLINTSRIDASNGNISLATLPTGIYVAKVSIEGQSKSFKIVKK